MDALASAEKLTSLEPAYAPSDAIASDDMDRLTTILFGASAFQHLTAACELGLFELLRHKPDLTRDEICAELQLQTRAAEILLLGTTALRLTKRVRDQYSNSAMLERLFSGGMWNIFKDTVAFEQHIVYEAQTDFCESLKRNSNVGLRRVPGKGRDLYHRLAENPHLQSVFYKYMRSWSELATSRLLDCFPLHNVRRLLDMGGGDGVNAINLAKQAPQIHVTIFEIPDSAPIARKAILAQGLQDRIRVHAGDMFADEFPAGHDCIAFIHQLVIWTPEQNIELLQRAHAALPPGGRVVIYSSISDDEGDGPLMAALDSVYFAALPAEGGMIYCWRQYEEWLRAAGFRTMQRIPCRDWTPHGMIVATK